MSHPVSRVVGDKSESSDATNRNVDGVLEHGPLRRLTIDGQHFEGVSMEVERVLGRRHISNLENRLLVERQFGNGDVWKGLDVACHHEPAAASIKGYEAIDPLVSMRKLLERY